MVAGYAHTCVLDDEGVKCWGEGSGASKVPVLTHPRFLAAGYDGNCAIDDSGVKCWGDNIDSDHKIPVLKNPKEVAVGFNSSCAIDDTGVVCWGFIGTQYSAPQNLKNPRELSVGSAHACVRDDGGIHCWGSNYAGAALLPVPPKNPVLLAADGDSTCSIGENGLNCWGYGASSYDATIPAQGLSALTVLEDHFVCAIQNGFSKCVWDIGPSQFTPQTIGNGMSDATAIASANFFDTAGSSDYTVCSMNTKNLNCCMLSSAGTADCTDTKLAPKGLVHPKEFAMAEVSVQGSMPYRPTACVIDGTELKCTAGDTPPKNLKNPKLIAGTADGFCVVDSDEIVCWDDGGALQKFAPKKLKNPVSLSVGGERNCVIDDNGVQCWSEEVCFTTHLKA